jgi:predicted cupin superfamily sugar epimerase
MPELTCHHQAMSHPTLGPDEVTSLLGLEPHPEGGRFAETWRAPAAAGERATGTAIYFLLREGETSRWHRVDATEIWHHYAGAPLELSTADDEGRSERHVLGPDLASGQRPQAIVAPHEWQSATSLGAWTLVGCTVSPGFEFAGFELAPTDWSPPGTVGGAGR